MQNGKLITFFDVNNQTSEVMLFEMNGINLPTVKAIITRDLYGNIDQFFDSYLIEEGDTDDYED